MKLKRSIQTTLMTGITMIVMSASAQANIVTFSTDSPNTGFLGGGLVLDSMFGAEASLVFTPNGDITTGTPSNVNLGYFTLACMDCSTQAVGTGAHFSPFVFHLIVTDVTDGATGRFVGTSTGGTVYQNASPLSISWLPLQLGPDTTNAMTGDFGFTVFSTTGFTGIVAPNSGANLGRSTVQANVSSVAVVPDITEVPEPATISLVAGMLVGLGLLHRKLSLRG